MKLLKDETLVDTWKTFFEGHCKSEIETIALEYPEQRSLIVDYWDIDKTYPQLAEILINQPYKAIFNAEESLKLIDVAVDQEVMLHFRVKNIPDIQRLLIRKIRSHHLGKLTAVDGLVSKRTEVKPKLQVAAFECQKCAAIIKIEQDEDILKEPLECYDEQGGCGRVSSFKLSTNLSTFVDSQKIEIQENPEGLRGGEQPEKLAVYLEDDLVGKIVPGDRVIVNGILYSMQKRRGTFHLTSFDKAMDVLSIERQETAYEEVKITEDDEKKILQVSKDPDLYKNMRDSIAPAIYGRGLEKEAIVLQQFGGVAKEVNRTKIREDIHVLFVGDPGTAKSQMIYWASRLSPRSVFCSGKGVTSAGLTASVVRDDFGEGQWTLEAGALVLADMGIACIDELDKMDSNERDALHEAMAQQEIHISKAGINATLKSRCSVLAGANPKLGRFDEFIPIHEQINLAPALISRFDLIFSIIDKPDRNADAKLAKHIFKTQRNQGNKQIIPPYEPEFIRKYVAYAKQNIKPEMTDAMEKKITDFFVETRQSGGDSIAITPRQLEALIRLSEASAKVRLSEKVTEEDAKRAIYIFDQYLRRVGMDRETGKFDIDIIATGISHSQQQRMRTIIGIITDLSKSNNAVASKDDIINEAEIKSVSVAKTKAILDYLKRNGQIYESKPNYYRLSEE